MPGKSIQSETTSPSAFGTFGAGMVTSRYPVNVDGGAAFTSCERHRSVERRSRASYEKDALAVIVTFASCLGGTVLGIGILVRAFDTVEEADETVVGAAWPCLDCLEALPCSRNPRFMTGDGGGNWSR
jgi:hypothetical protein